MKTTQQPWSKLVIGCSLWTPIWLAECAIFYFAKLGANIWPSSDNVQMFSWQNWWGPTVLGISLLALLFANVLVERSVRRRNEFGCELVELAIFLTIYAIALAAWAVLQASSVWAVS